MNSLAADLQLALDLADEADQSTLAYFRSDTLAVDTKADLLPVSQADRDVEEPIRRRLRRGRPGHDIVGEEFGSTAGNGAAWIVDPVDGTKRFIRGVPLFARLLALQVDGETRLGVVPAPALGRRWWAARGLGAFADGHQIHVSSIQRLADAHLSLASPDSWRDSDLFPQFRQLAESAWSTTAYGDFWIHLLVAEGSADGALEPTAALCTCRRCR